MKTKVEIRKYYNLKIKELIKHNKLYYDKLRSIKNCNDPNTINYYIKCLAKKKKRYNK